MVEVSLEQKVRDFNTARKESLTPVEKLDYVPRTHIPKDRAFELLEQSGRPQLSFAESLIADTDYSLVEPKLAWLENYTARGDNGTIVLRRDAHTKFAPTWSKGRLVQRTPILYLRSVEDVYAALEAIAHKANPNQYRLTRATAPFESIFSYAAGKINTTPDNARLDFFESKFGESSHEYRLQKMVELESLAQQRAPFFPHGPFLGASMLVDTLRTQFGAEYAQRAVDKMKPFILYGIVNVDSSRTQSPQSHNVTAYHVYAQPRAGARSGKQLTTPKYTAPRVETVAHRPTVQIAYHPLYGGQAFVR